METGAVFTMFARAIILGGMFLTLDFVIASAICRAIRRLRDEEVLDSDEPHRRY